MNTNRVDEIVAAMKSFGKDKYQKSELLTEMLALQQEIVDLTFNDDHASIAELRIWDVEKHLEQMNQDCGNVADEELGRFIRGSKTLCNLIKMQISGNKGEAKVFRILQYIHSKNIILKNVELSDGDLRTELDAVVITPGTITIIEVKNTARDIFIDEKGNYYRTGEFLRWDCNIAEKMTLKENLLRKVLLDNKIRDIQIRSIVVFTNNRIEVQNKYSRIRTCFISQLTYIIDSFKCSENLTEEEMRHIEGLIKTAECKEVYPFEFNVAQYKMDFAMVMAVLEEASAKAEEPEMEKEAMPERKESAKEILRNLFISEYAEYAGSVAAIMFITTVVLRTIKKGGVLR